ncbi:dihydropteroate synthase [Stenotrophomonas koreensis]|uniref:Dihydropteroate synthase n=1 Tax=Stenotrophomonas koreensis TaxID=266128 RepID=A0A0R0C199_9GAMM|nr:dihydropteroate synthase [Stenotrophomonas koreensis]KRG59703.1 dihydropteroate synthase [Stenotrophomonas koreensis]
MFDTRPSLRCAGRRLYLDQPQVMGVLNVTPDSFSDGGLHLDPAQALVHARAMLEQGASIIDVGGESTRPGATAVSESEEIDRIAAVIERLAAELDVVVSVDTFKPAVMRAAIAAGAHMINDIQALQQPGALEVVAGSDVAVVLMHAVGGPYQAGSSVEYTDVVEQVRSFLAQRVLACEFSGIARERLVLDPGYGFNKDSTQNFQLLARQQALCGLGLPLLAGLSRKRCIAEATGREIAAERVAGSVAAHLIAVQQGAQIVRVHDVAATVDALKVWQRVAALRPPADMPESARPAWPDDC